MQVIALLFIIFSTLVLFRVYLSFSSTRSLETFRAQNLSEITAVDVMALSKGLSVLKASDGVICAIGRRDGHAFFEEASGSCTTGVLAQKVVLDQSELNGLVIELTYTLPFQARLIAAALIFLQALFLASIAFFSRRIEFERNRRHVELADLARSVAHDLRSPLSALNLVSAKIALRGTSAEVELLQSAAQRIEAIAQDLLKGKVAETKAISGQQLTSALHQLMQMKNQEWSERLAVATLSFAVDLTPNVQVHAELSDLIRIVSNLINNAFEAIPANGSITVTATADPSHVVIAVQDNGKGIPKEIQDRLLKEQVTFGKDKGHGLGLWSAAKKVESWSGQMAIAANRNQGTAVTLKLLAKSAH